MKQYYRLYVPFFSIFEEDLCFSEEKNLFSRHRCSPVYTKVQIHTLRALTEIALQNL